MHDILDVIKNIESIYESNSSLAALKDFERVLAETNMYVYENWEEGEIVWCCWGSEEGTHEEYVENDDWITSRGRLIRGWRFDLRDRIAENSWV